MTPALLDEIDGYRLHFDTMYVGGIPHLLNEDGAYLAFLAIVSATDALAGLFAPMKGAGERFRIFVATYFPEDYHPFADRLWELRNAIVHSFNPGPFFGLTFHTSRQHLKSTGLDYLNSVSSRSAFWMTWYSQWSRPKLRADSVCSRAATKNEQAIFFKSLFDRLALVRTMTDRDISLSAEFPEASVSTRSTAALRRS